MSLPPSSVSVPVCPATVSLLWYAVRGCCLNICRLAEAAEEEGDPEGLYLELVSLAEVVRILWIISNRGRPPMTEQAS